MSIRALAVAVCAVATLASAGSAAPDPAQAFINARILPVTSAAIEKGTLVVQDGKVVAVGASGQVSIPAGATTVDLAGKTVMPGIVDSHSHIGSPAGGDSSAPIQPDVRVLDAVDVRSTSIRRAQAGGVTTANVMPGSGHLLSGQTIYLKLRRGNTIEDLEIVLPDGRIAGGLKMANGTNSIRTTGSGPFPGTRAKSAALVREQFIKAVEYRDKVRKAGDATDTVPRPRDGSARRSFGRQAHGPLSHAPPRRHRHRDPAVAGVRFWSYCTTCRRAGKWPTRSRRPVSSRR
jgi:imidazolonepropionase-like amidohydrolase